MWLPEIGIVLIIAAIIWAALAGIFAAGSWAQDSTEVARMAQPDRDAPSMIASAVKDESFWEAMEADADALATAAAEVAAAKQRAAACREALRVEQESTSALHVELTKARANSPENPESWWQAKWVERLGLAGAGVLTGVGALLTARAVAR
jgi:hypothetical protein